jgi:hypothetical protein
MLLCSLFEGCLGVVFDFFYLLQKSVFLFQNCVDILAKEWGIGLSERLYFRHGFSEHLLFILGYVWISICEVVYEAELLPFWLKVEVCNEVLGILHDKAIFCDLHSIFSLSNACRILRKMGKD